MATADGDWNIDIASPLGSFRFTLDLAKPAETTEKPDTLALDLTVDGGSLSGTAKAGHVTAAVKGTRASEAAGETS